jgi:hypothetical protein
MTPITAEEVARSLEVLASLKGRSLQNSDRYFRQAALIRALEALRMAVDLSGVAKTCQPIADALDAVNKLEEGK